MQSSEQADDNGVKPKQRTKSASAISPPRSHSSGRARSVSPSLPMSDPGEAIVIHKRNAVERSTFRRSADRSRRLSIHVPAVVPFNMDPVDKYVAECKRLSMIPDAGVMTTLATHGTHLQFSYNYPLIGCLLPLRDLLTHFETIDLARDRGTQKMSDGNSNMFVLRTVLANPDCKIRKLVLSHNGIDVSGISALAEGLVRNVTVLDLVLKGNCLGFVGGAKFYDIMQARAVKYRLLDASFCSLGTDVAGDFLSLHRDDVTSQALVHTNDLTLYLVLSLCIVAVVYSSGQ